MTVINTAPTLITERLQLDAHTLDDFESLAALWADPQVVRYIGGTPRDREDSWGAPDALRRPLGVVGIRVLGGT